MIGPGALYKLRSNLNKRQDSSNALSHWWLIVPSRKRLKPVLAVDVVD
jgi:hypothetical protein